MKSIAIITIYDNTNYGNRLQNYALQYFLENMGFNVITLKNFPDKNNLIRKLKNCYRFIKNKCINDEKDINRLRNFEMFTDNYLKNTSLIYTGDNLNSLNDQYDYFVIGSDQIWNYLFRGEYFGNFEFAMFADNEKCLSYSASIGINNISTELQKICSIGFNHLKNISVREDRGKEIVEELTNRKGVEVLVDPTMLLTPKQWDKVSKKPKQLKFDKYILNYFLGELSQSRKEEIERIAMENNCHIINILDRNDPFYVCGPSEFLCLEKHAFLICTDSFHASVFAFLYDRPFIIFEREDNTVKMNSRIDTLLNKFELKDRRFEEKITKKNLSHDYKKSYKILETERKKSYDFLRKALQEK